MLYHWSLSKAVWPVDWGPLKVKNDYTTININLVPKEQNFLHCICKIIFLNSLPWKSCSGLSLVIGHITDQLGLIFYAIVHIISTLSRCLTSCVRDLLSILVFHCIINFQFNIIVLISEPFCLALLLLNMVIPLLLTEKQ